MDTERFLAKTYADVLRIARKHNEITETNYEYLLLKNPRTIDEFHEAFPEVVHFIDNKAYYALLERIENGERILASETDPMKRKRYREALDKLSAELEQLKPREEAG